MTASSSSQRSSPTLPPWRPGLWGKGFFDANGTAYVWATAVGPAGYEPTRLHAAATQLTPALRDRAQELTGGHLDYLTPVSIRPDGVYHVAHERTRWAAAIAARPNLENDQRFAAARFSDLDGRLRQEPDHDTWMAAAISELH